MRAKEKHRKRLLDYLKVWDNPFPNRNEMATILGIKVETLYYHFTPDEMDEMLNDGLELRKKNSAVPRSEVYKAMRKAADDGIVPAMKEFLERTEGKVVDRHELTGKGGKKLAVEHSLDASWKDLLESVTGDNTDILPNQKKESPARGQG